MGKCFSKTEGDYRTEEYECGLSCCTCNWGKRNSSEAYVEPRSTDLEAFGSCEPVSGSDVDADESITSNRANESNSPLTSANITPSSYSIRRLRIDPYVLETLKLLRTLVGNYAEPPNSMLKLHRIAEMEDGWMLVVKSMIRCIPDDDPLGPAAITLLLDDCPLPSKENSRQLSQSLDLKHAEKYDNRQKRNVCIVLGCLAEKLAGQNSTTLLNEETLAFLLGNLDPSVAPTVNLYSIIALEKFAQTSENKSVINRALQRQPINPFFQLEKFKNLDDYEKRQVGFCAEWTLDNIFLVKGRPFGYELVNNSEVNVILNSYDVSEYLKIAPHGLEARCDAASFESVRSTFQVDSGCWYYEVLIITEGVMQIGWATKASKFLNHEGYGIGDDEYSVAYDGCRQVMWHSAQSEPIIYPCWKPGDILGTLIDLDNFTILFFLNGDLIISHNEVFIHAKSGFFAAGSFMSFQQCCFNFGSQPFKFPPNGYKANHFKNFNEYARLGDECRVVLPRHLKMEYLRKVSVKDNSCTLCFDHIANVRLLPCEHCGFCSNCADQLDSCPMCRQPIENKINIFDKDFNEKVSDANTNNVT